MSEIEFKAFPKIPRIESIDHTVVITEKLDGTNAQIAIGDDGTIRFGSRSRWLSTQTKTSDNYGFCAWGEANREELLKLGPGRHFGEWYGRGIGRGYGLEDRRFALFNTARWNRSTPESTPPPCCEVATILYAGVPLDLQELIAAVAENLSALGSAHVPGFMRPEGVVAFLCASGMSVKKIIDKTGPSPMEGAA